MKIMNELPGSVRAKIMNTLEQDNLESVHMGCGSPLDGDNTYFIAMAHERDPETPNCYSLYIYDSEEDKLLCYADNLTYADALISVWANISTNSRNGAIRSVRWGRSPNADDGRPETR